MRKSRGMNGGVSTLAFVLSCVCYGQQDFSRLTTNDSPNGRFWRITPATTKKVYLIGFSDGEMLAVAQIIDEVPSARKAGMKVASKISLHDNRFTPDDYIKELDMLYTDTENVNISLPVAIL